MRRIIAGIIISFYGFILFIYVHWNAIRILPNITVWNTRLGIFGTALVQNRSLILFITSILLFGYGIFLLLSGSVRYDCCIAWLKKITKKIGQMGKGYSNKI